MNVGVLAEAAFSSGVEVVSFWWGSPANLRKRSAQEVIDIVGALREWMAGEAMAILSRSEASFEVVGAWERDCPMLGAAPAGEGRRRLVCLMAYDGREEIEVASRRAAAAGNAGEIAPHLWTAHLPPVDLVIRTGGESHLSAGFMLWQIAEARLAFLSEMWPALTPDRLRDVLASQPDRRFGA